MAKSSRASSRKANNQRLKANVFGPVEAARAAGQLRLHAGRIRRLREAEGLAELAFRRRGDGALQELRVAHLLQETLDL